jgi:hypothetical protein
VLQPYALNGSFSVDVAGGQTGNGTQIQQTTSGVDSQKFSIVSVGGGNHKIAMKAAPTKCIDSQAGGNGTKTILWDCNGNTVQSWQIAPDSVAGVFTLRNMYSNRCLGNGASTTSGSQLQIWDCSSTNNYQKFFIKTVQ